MKVPRHEYHGSVTSVIFWFSNESSNCLPVRMYNHIGCICLAFPHCVILWLVAGVWPTGRRIRRPKRGGRFPTKLPERRVGSTCTTRIGWGATTDVQRCNLHQATSFRGKQGWFFAPFFGHSTDVKYKIGYFSSHSTGPHWSWIRRCSRTSRCGNWYACPPHRSFRLEVTAIWKSPNQTK